MQPKEDRDLSERTLGDPISDLKRVAQGGGSRDDENTLANPISDLMRLAHGGGNHSENTLEDPVFDLKRAAQGGGTHSENTLEDPVFDLKRAVHGGDRSSEDDSEESISVRRSSEFDELDEREEIDDSDAEVGEPTVRQHAGTALGWSEIETAGAPSRGESGVQSDAFEDESSPESRQSWSDNAEALRGMKREITRHSNPDDRSEAFADDSVEARPR